MGNNYEYTNICDIMIKNIKKRTYNLIRRNIFDFEKIIELVPNNAKDILDLGCGNGILSFLLSSKYPNKKIVGSDINKSRIQYLNKTNKEKNLKFIQSDANKFNFKYDVIFCVDLLHHITYKKQNELLKSIYEKSKKNTIIIIKDMDKSKYSIRHLFNFLIDIISAKQYPLYYHDKNSFKKLFLKNKFKISQIKYFNKWYIPLNHICFILKK